ncbi:rCG29637 [Rattus norvegicus]|uniref:RCG29637 n=1 Tax=Rattus norvegicus TaxID=10116 RepID=A6ILF9_RAT|nr:rCG29637 [Rattus norvegicus]
MRCPRKVMDFNLHYDKMPTSPSENHPLFSFRSPFVCLSNLIFFP